MDAEIKTKWVEALRSGKYEQGTEQLYSEGKYCCLGVLCDIVDPRGRKWKRATLPPETIVEKAGLDLPSPFVHYDARKEPLVVLNDGYGLTFPELADLIEAQL